MFAIRLRYTTPRSPPTTRALRIIIEQQQQQQRYAHDHLRSRDPEAGLTTPVPEESHQKGSISPFYFEAGYAGWAKRPTRPFPPPFFSPPSGSFSDPLTTHHRNRNAGKYGSKVDGEMIRGVTNGDDALLVSDNLIGTNDGVGAWAQRERGCAPLWSRLILHFWAVAAEEDGYGSHGEGAPDPVRYLDVAYQRTKEALSEPNEWLGTTTASSALLHYKGEKPVVYVTQLGDSKVMVVRPSEKKILFETEEQWHYFDCPRQLGTNSPDTPDGNAVMDKVEVEVDDIVLAMSDGVTDNLWEEEISETAVMSLEKWKAGVGRGETGQDVGEGGSLAEGMRFVANELVLAARKVAEDPFAASPFMERAVEEGLAIEGGKLDDISVVAALCRRRKS
ncbi:hypothetical protein EJ03DRAFT_211347 [Teratosphaeria nubilosa]|uniref:Protein phosphatase n=1 Tax=Teratosphaeria nubilosa TaxID=161662 RepID=A0A6G1LIN6_9PEZI|nr:hypothetical protein EJ03DRAFT_211347 [Teratosphaeria nubilosa]